MRCDSTQEHQVNAKRPAWGCQFFSWWLLLEVLAYTTTRSQPARILLRNRLPLYGRAAMRHHSSHQLQGRKRVVLGSPPLHLTPLWPFLRQWHLPWFCRSRSTTHLHPSGTSCMEVAQRDQRQILSPRNPVKRHSARTTHYRHCC